MQRIRVIDCDEYRLIVTLGRDGKLRVSHTGMCATVAADLMRHIADRLEDDHPPRKCDPSDETDTEPDQPMAPAPGYGSVLDPEARLWLDGAGHTWDLSLTWEDAAGEQWRWTGRRDGLGVPTMRPLLGGETQPLDTLRVVGGPTVPVAGDGS